MNILSGDDFKKMRVLGLHCGSGTILHRNFLNIDIMQLSDYMGRQSYPDCVIQFNEGIYYLQHDQTISYPIEDEVVDFIFSEHFIEHITFDDAIFWLSEVYRLLKPGGVARISTPDLSLYSAGYCDSEQKFFTYHHQRLQRLIPDCPTRPAWMLNQIFYFYGHKWIYDFDELRLAATSAGFDFNLVQRCSYKCGSAPELYSMDQEIRSHESLYVELIKDIK